MFSPLHWIYSSYARFLKFSLNGGLCQTHFCVSMPYAMHIAHRSFSNDCFVSN